MTDCPNLTKTFTGCHFEPRYDKEAIDLSKAGPLEIKGDNSIALDAFRKITYVHDICTRCGKIIHRKEKENK